MDRANSYGQTRAHTTETFSRTISTVKVNTNGLMVVSTTDNGLTTRWKAKAHLHGAMVVDMKAIIRMIKSTDMVPSNGLMEGSISASGVKENNTEKEFTSKKARKDKVSGKWERELSGSRTKLTSDSESRLDNKDL